MSVNNNETVLYLVRHGTTDYNAALKYQGLSDIPLNDTGREQGKLLTHYFRDIHIDLGVSSNLSRAKETLEYILGSRSANQGGGVPVIIEPDLHEINLGIFERRPVAEVGILFPEFQDDFIWRPGSLKVPRGESSVQVYNRMRDAILRIVNENQGKVIAIASHGFAIQTWLNYASGINIEDMREWTLDNVAVSKFTFTLKDIKDIKDINNIDLVNKFNIKVDFIGDSSHLTPDLRRNYNWEELAHPAPLLLYKSDRPRDILAINFVRRLKNRYKIRFQARDLVTAPLHEEEVEAVASKKIINQRPSGLTATSPKSGGKDRASILKSIITSGPVLVTRDAAVTGFRKSEYKKLFIL